MLSSDDRLDLTNLTEERKFNDFITMCKDRGVEPSVKCKYCLGRGYQGIDATTKKRHGCMCVLKQIQELGLLKPEGKDATSTGTDKESDRDTKVSKDTQA